MIRNITPPLPPHECCDVRGCTRKAAALPVLRLWPLNRIHRPDTAVDIAIGLSVCDAHRALAGVDHFLNDEQWLALVHKFTARGGAAPDRASVELHWQAIEAVSA